MKLVALVALVGVAGALGGALTLIALEGALRYVRERARRC